MSWWALYSGKHRANESAGSSRKWKCSADIMQYLCSDTRLWLYNNSLSIGWRLLAKNRTFHIYICWIKRNESTALDYCEKPGIMSMSLIERLKIWDNQHIFFKWRTRLWTLNDVLNSLQPNYLLLLTIPMARSRPHFLGIKHLRWFPYLAIIKRSHGRILLREIPHCTIGHDALYHCSKEIAKITARNHPHKCSFNVLWI